MNNLVSCIITTYNRADLLPRAIKSVLNQTHSSLECIVVDDASTDSTPEVIQRFSDPRLIYIRHKTNKHLSAARNTGIKNSKGNLIAFLDDDDEWLSSKLEKQVALLQSLPQSYGMVYCWMNYYEENQLIGERHPTLRGYIFDKLIDTQPLGNGSTWLVRKTVFEKIGDFDETLLRGIDGDYLRRLCFKYQADLIPEILVYYHVGRSDRITSNSIRSLHFHIESLKVRLEKFEKELINYPEVHTNILSQVAGSYTLISEYDLARSYIQKAILVSPKRYSLYKTWLKLSLKVIYQKVQSVIN